jgi:DNA-binding NarL/FixJ family response regulator
VTGVGEGTVERLRVHVHATDPAVRAGVLTKLRRAAIALTAEPDRSPDTVVVAAARTVDEALDACGRTWGAGGYRLLVVADTFSPAGVRRALRGGARAMLRSTEATPAQLVAAVHSARHGDGRMPYDVLIRLLNGVAEPPAPVTGTSASGSPLTPRQTAVLTLMSEGHGNAQIARALSCSEHTVKNVIYDLMARLQARNRAHAVGLAVRTGLI